jgi:hypothetical protein
MPSMNLEIKKKLYEKDDNSPSRMPYFFLDSKGKDDFFFIVFRKTKGHEHPS